MAYLYSASTGGFYSSEIHDDIPSDAVEVSDSDYEALFAGQETGKIITADNNGKPTLSDPPALTADQLLAQATAQRDSLMATATVAIAPLQDAVDLDEATTEETASLKAWKSYRVTLNRLDLSAAPDIVWPTVPSTSDTSTTTEAETSTADATS